VKKRKKWIWVLVILLILFIGGYGLFGGRQTVRYAEDTAVTGNLSTYYNFTGTVDVTNSVKLTSPSDAKISEVYAQPNSQVADNARLMRLDDGTILKADIAGEVTGLTAEAGNYVRTGDALLEILDLSSMKATFQVDEYDVAAVTIGKPVSITIDGTGESFEAPITALDMRAVQSGDLSYYTATVDLRGVQLPEGTMPGMQISVNVPHQQADNTVLLKISAISFGANNQPYVLMQGEKSVRQVPVEVGINDGTHVQILSGVNAGDTVVYTPAAAADLQEIFTNRSNNVANRVAQE